MYGNCLKEQNFKDLLNCHSVSEVAGYLKNRTAYAVALKDINESTIHRGYLELLLKRKIFNDYASLSRYDLTVGSQLSGYLIQQGEIEEIISCLRLMNAGRPEEFLFNLPLFFADHSHLDFVKMSHAETFGGLLDALSGKPYRKILEMYPPGADGRVRLTEIENALYTRLVHTLFAVIDRTKGDLHRQMVDLCGAQIDAQNVTRILRLKRFFHASADDIRSQLLPYGGSLSPKIMERMIEADTPQEVRDLFFSTAIGRQVPENKRHFTYDLYLRAPYYNARRHIHYSIHPMVVMASYIILTQAEVDDMINVIEGIRYGVPPEEIKPMLLLVDQ